MNEKRLLDQFNDYLEQYKILHEDFKDDLKQWMIRAMQDAFKRGRKEGQDDEVVSSFINVFGEGV